MKPARHTDEANAQIHGGNGRGQRGIPKLDGQELQATSLIPDFKTILDSIPHIVWVTSADGQTLYLNDRAHQYTGLPVGETLGERWISLMHPDDLTQILAVREQTLSSNVPGALECRIRRHDGQYRWMDVRGVPWERDGHVTAWMGTCTDIDDRKQLEEALLHSEQKMAEELTISEMVQSSAPLGLGFVDSEFRFVKVNQRLAQMNGHSVEEHLGRPIADLIPELWPTIEPLYRRILEIGDPIVDIEVSGETVADPGITHSWLVNLYPVRMAEKIIGIGIIVSDVTERLAAERAHIALMRAAIGAIANTVEARDPYTAGHNRRVAEIAAAIANDLGLSADEVEGITLAAEIHDIGKIAIPAEILSRPGKLAPAEFELIKGHSSSGHDIVAKIDFPWPVATMILQHHERFDGTGYPSGLCGDEIILGARIIAVADVLEAMASHRPYRASKGLQPAIQEIEAGRGTLFDPRVADSCLRLFSEGHLQLEFDSSDAVF